MDTILLEIRGIARKYPEIQKILLFGSRARGDHRRKSDIDIAVFSSGMERPRWRAFREEIEESVRTLLEFDIVLVDDYTESFFLHNILADGVPIYEKVGD